MARIDDVLNVMRSQIGKPYQFAAPVDINNPNPPAFDCSALPMWACGRLGVAPAMPRTSMLQHQHFINNGTLLGDIRSDRTVVARAMGIRGAMMIRSLLADGKTVADPAQADGGRSHIAISLGDGTVLEARGGGQPVSINAANPQWRLWTAAGLIPGVDYSATPQGLPGNAHARVGRPHLLQDSNRSAINYRGADRRTWVIRLQQLLIERGLLTVGGADGAFGRFTNNALLSFQQFVATHHVGGFTVDGDCGPQTWGWLLYLTGHGLEE
jgi:Putative peptidoglycan binding domain